MAASNHLQPRQFWKGHIRMSAIPAPTQPVDQMRVADITSHVKGGGSLAPLEIQAGRLFNGNHRKAALDAAGSKTAPVVAEGAKPRGMLYSQQISEHEFEGLAGYTHEEDM